MRWFVLSLIGSLIVVPTGCGQPGGNEMLKVDRTKGVVNNDIGIASFPTPDQWISNRSDGNTVVVLTRANSNSQTAEEMISIDIGTSASKDVKASAEGFAGKFSGNVTLLPFRVDGEQAYRVTIPANHEHLQPRECIAVHHAGKVCFMIGGSRARNDIWPVLEEIAKSWHWK